jgi:hypothetical protein
MSVGSAFVALADPPSRRYRQDPVLWAQERMRLHLWSKQKQIITSVRDNSKTTVHSCHQIGKSFIAAVTVAWWLDVHPPGTAFVVTTAPTGPQVEAVLWREINKLHQLGDLPGRTNLTEWYMGKEMVAYGRKPADNNPHAFQGVHARYFLVVLDEACGIPKILWDAASTLAANVHSRTLAIGNPDDPVGEFADNCKADSGWNVIGVGYQDTPNFTGEPVPRVVSESLISPGWVEDRRKKWGENSALFQSKCRGEFPTVGDPYQTIPLGWANQCRYLDFPLTGEPREAGIDVAAGNDRTVLMVREGQVAIHVDEFQDADPMRTVGRLALALAEWDVQRVKIDVGGLGWGIYGRLRELSSKTGPAGEAIHDAEVIAVNFGSLPTPGLERKFLNKRAELWWQVGRENSRLAQWDLSRLGSHLDDVIHELTMPKFEILDSHGKIKIEPKKEIIKRLSASPDLADALLLAFYRATSSLETPATDALATDLVRGTHPADLSQGSLAGTQRNIWSTSLI